MNPVLTLDQISRRFKPNIPALKCVSLDLNKGDKVLLKGPNGSGKTTLLRIIAGLLLPDSGKIQVLGFNPQTESHKVKRKLGYMLASDQCFFPRLTGRENLMMFALASGVNKSKAISKVTEWSKIKSVHQALERPYFLCSSGMKQALNFVRSVIHEPDLILLDEPFRSLDQESIAFINEAFTHQLSDKSVIVTSHNTNTIGFAHQHMSIEEGILCS